MKIKCLFVLALLILSACREDFSPKPIGYFRIEMDKSEYALTSNECAYRFLANKQAKLIKGKGYCWYNIQYPTHNATIYLTYKKLDSNLASIIEESHKLAYDHSVKSNGIIEKVYANEEDQVYGVLYDIHGNSASNLQFFVTDSTNHFLRGSLYFNSIPNADSLQPVKDFIKDDLEVLIESLKWS
tara:strand:- start:9855 stop:10409 length:555 start_codon:yes stop_codon:yes gene_type:complete